MKKKSAKKIILISVLLLLITIFFSNNIVMAEINQEYYGKDPVNSSLVDDAVAGSTVLTWIAKLVYAVAGMLEKIVGTAFQMLTGTNDFPWADKIVFNAVPMLDVNFINPNGASFVGNPNISGLIQNVYQTILAIAISFFGIAVMITSIKLVISTIASEKAKYKKAVVDWVVGLVMLFCIHFGISLMFYINEQLVVVASKLALANYDVVGDTLDEAFSDAVQQAIDNAGDSKYGDKLKETIGIGPQGPNANRNIADILSENVNIVETWMYLDKDDDAYGLYEFLMKDVDAGGISDAQITEWGQMQNFAMIISWAAEENISVKRLEEIYNEQILCWYDNHTAGRAITLDVFKEIFGDHWLEILKWLYSHEALSYYFTNSTKDVLANEFNNKENFVDGPDIACGKKYCSDDYRKSLANRHVAGYGYDAAHLDLIFSAGEDLSGFGAMTWEWAVNALDVPFTWFDVIKDLIALKASSPTANYGEPGYDPEAYVPENNNNSKLFSQLSNYFKFFAYEREIDEATSGSNHGSVTGITPDYDKPIIQNMLMYAILLGQSIVLFIAYIKRLFYVVMLSLMAPVVVVFDFFQKFGK